MVALNAEWVDLLVRFAPLFMLTAGSVPPYSMGIFETIVAVHFEDGLAVEFLDGSD